MLQANLSKSALYIARVKQDIKAWILDTLGFTEGTFPFKYLGIPLDTKKLSVGHFYPIIERITERVTCWSAKLLSYAGRSQLIKSVIFGIQTYWSQVFILPKKVLKAIEQICRTFLWTGSVNLSRKALVAWDSVCRPFSAGGLNIIDMALWNKAALSKQLWNLAKKKDCLWIHWVHSYYIKQRDIETLSSPGSTSWVVKKILARREYIMKIPRLQGS